MKNALLIRAAGLLWLATLGACGHSSSGPATVGVGIGVALSSPTGTTQVPQNGTLVINAVVNGDSANAGVTWALTGSGSIATSSTTSATYQAPNGIVGAVFATLTATSKTDPTKSASVTLTANGTPTILQPVLFPANQNVPYTTYISAAGGTAPYTWAIAAGGSLPAGLSLSGSTTAATSITGTPSALGTSTFTVTLTDVNKQTASIALSLTVAPQTACLLSGQYAYLVTGFHNGQPATRAGSLAVTTAGTITGIHDYKDAADARPATNVTSGTCQTLTQNRGQLHISSASGNETFDFATVSSLTAGHMQQDDGTGVVEAGQFFQQDPTAFSSAALAGDWVFGLVGDDGAKQRLAVVGRLTLDAIGTISGGVADDNAATPAVDAALTGTLIAPDTHGRGTATLSVGGQPLPIAYYVIDQKTVFVVSNDTSTTTPRVAGRMTRQTGAGTLDATALASPAILSMWGASIAAGLPVATITAGRLSGAAGGTVSVELDVADRGAQGVNAVFTASPYSVTANGRGALAIGSAAPRNFVLYADGAGGAYLLEPASTVGNFGILEMQAPGPFSDFTTAYYVGGTVFPGTTSPITLAPQLLFQAGTIGGNLTGNYALDPVTGRMVASVSRTILGGSDLVIYIVSQNKLVIIGDSLNISDSQLAWFERY